MPRSPRDVSRVRCPAGSPRSVPERERRDESRPCAPRPALANWDHRAHAGARKRRLGRTLGGSMDRIARTLIIGAALSAAGCYGTARVRGSAHIVTTPPPPPVVVVDAGPPP